MGRLTNYERQRLILLRNQYKTLKDLRVALLEENIEVSRQSISAFFKKVDTHGTTADLPRAGRIPILAPRHLDFIDDLISRDRESSARDIQTELTRVFQIRVSVPTIKRLRRKLGWVYTGTKYCQMVRRVNMPLRQAFCLDCIANGDRFDNVIFSDESSICIDSSTNKCFRRRGEPRQLISRPKHPMKVHIWAGISWRGATKVCIFQGIMDSEFYVHILETHLLPFIQERYPHDHRFQQDNDPKHTARVTTEWFAANQINLWPTPAESPDLNPIENMWAALKAFIKRRSKPQTLEELTRGILDFWETVTPEMCQRYISHLHKVMPVVIAREGGPSGY